MISEATSQDHRGHTSDLLLLSAIWSVMVLIAKPIADIPLNDDWTYGVSVKALVEDGRWYFLTEWANKTLVAHVLWGALFCLPFGFSYTALRFSQLTAGLLGIFATYWLCRELGASRRTATLCAITVLVNPTYFQMANSFMTDVSFAAFCTLAVWLIVRGVLRSRHALVVTGWILAVISVWVRELTVMLPAGYAATRVYISGFAWRNLLRAVVPMAVVAALLFVHQNYMVSWLGFPNLHNPRTTYAMDYFSQLGRFSKIVIRGMTDLFIYVGLYCVPLLLWFRGKYKYEPSLAARWVAHVFSGLFVLASIWTMWDRGKIMPLLRNSIIDYGLGPATLCDVLVRGLPNFPKAPSWIWGIVTALGLLAGIALVRFVVFTAWQALFPKNEDRKSSGRWALFFLLASIAAYSVLIIPSGYFDRYLIVYIPFVAALLVMMRQPADHPSRSIIVTTCAIVVVFGFYGAFATHDYISWNRIRWDLVYELNGARGIPPEKIDGGYEVNGSLLFDAGINKDPNKSWWWVVDDEYMITFGPVPGYETVMTRSFPNYLYGENASLRVLKRIE